MAGDEETPDQPVESEASADARVPPPHEHAGRAQRAQSPSTKRALATHPGLIVRLKHTQAFSAVYRRGRWARGGSLSIGALPNAEQSVRIGLRTRRGLRGAVVRNRLKRQLRVIIAAQGPRLRDGLDLVVVIHPISLPAASARLEREFLALCQRAGALT